MISQYELFNSWGVWLSFSSGNKKDDSWGKNLKRVHQLKSCADLGYFSKESFLGKMANFFPDPETGKYTKYEIDSQMRKIESVNFFKGDIEPTWEYGDNDKGGYFNFPVFKDVPEENAFKVYNNLIMAIMGNSMEICSRLNGIRFVDTISKYNQRFRVEIWTDYRDEELELLQQHTNEISAFLVKDCGFPEIKTLKFYNIDREDRKVDKGPKNDNEKDRSH